MHWLTFVMDAAWIAFVAWVFFTSWKKLRPEDIDRIPGDW